MPDPSPDAHARQHRAAHREAFHGANHMGGVAGQLDRARAEVTRLTAVVAGLRADLSSASRPASVAIRRDLFAEDAPAP
ncbi:MAG: hypothetical protein JWM33_400 [Caulobacteraceae bacterium]|nr:hypothetical protein [Caulobacteraceae bacterium]